MENITIIGAGNWALGLGTILADNGFNILIWGRNQKIVEEINNLNTCSKYLGNYKLNKKIKATGSLEEAFSFSKTIVISLPVLTIEKVLSSYFKKYSDCLYILSSKGLSNGSTISMIMSKYIINPRVVALSGPSFAKEVLEKKRTAVVAASNDLFLAKQVQEMFSNLFFRVYISNDLIGVEYLGAIKNVLAIVTGMMDGANMGNNSRAVIIARSLVEMEKILDFVGGKKETLYGLAGIGDIVLTATSLESRNYKFGYTLIKEKIDISKDNTIEGLNTIKEIYEIVKNNSIDTPIINALYNILFLNSTIEEETDKIMKRKLKAE